MYGTVRDSKLLEVISGADVGVSWLDLSFDKKTGVSQTRMGGAVRSDPTGAYAICGIPNGTGIQVRATFHSASSPYVDLTMGALRVHRRDLMLGTPDSSGAARVEIVIGEMYGASGQAIVNARIITDGVPETRSDSKGRLVRGSSK